MKSKDIAKLAGVSRSTVSKVVNNYPGIPNETRQKILKVIKENNYVPNRSAQILAGKASKIIGLFVVDLNNEETNRIIISPYFSSFIAIAIDSAKSEKKKKANPKPIISNEV